MKIKKEFVLRNVYGENALVPVGDSASSLKKIIKVNELGSFIWNNLESAKNEDEIVSSDIITTHAGSIFDATLTEIQEAADGSQLVKTVAWYDNEAGFVGNMVRTLEYFAKL